MELSTVWFLLIAVLWTAFLVLEGFDFGVGMLLRPLGRTDTERRVMINTIGPVWDGNEVWLITAAGAMFAAFPEWYATLFSGFYLPLLFILIGLIIRGVGIELRGKIDDITWRKRCDLGLTFGSLLPAVLFGLLFGNLVRGVALDADHQYVGGILGVLHPFALLGAASTLLLFLTHGAVFLALKTDGEVRTRARKLAGKTSIASALVAGAFVLWAQIAYSVAWTWAATLLAALALVAVIPTNARGREGLAFIASTVAIVAMSVLIFGSMYPDVMPALDPANSLTVTNASSSPYTLKIMTVVAVLVTPVVLLYQGWSYWVFRKRISTSAIPPHAGLARRIRGK